jgi:hypothetical protein
MQDFAMAAEIEVGEVNAALVAPSMKARISDLGSVVPPGSTLNSRSLLPRIPRNGPSNPNALGSPELAPIDRHRRNLAFRHAAGTKPQHVAYPAHG